MFKRGSNTAALPRDLSPSRVMSKNPHHRARLACPWFISVCVWIPTGVVGALVLWLRLEDGGGIPLSSSWLRTNSWEGMDRTRTVVGSSHLALGANEFMGRHTALPIANLHSSPPYCRALGPSLSCHCRRFFSVASRVTGMDADVVSFMFVFQRSGVGRLRGVV